MKIAVIGMSALAASVLGATAFAAEVKTWEYRGHINAGTIADGHVATASVADDSLSILYLTSDDAFYVWFTHNGNHSFSQSQSNRAEIFIRTTNVSGSGRHDSDYVFTGKTVAQPDKNPRKPQFVVTNLSPEDVKALKKYDGNSIGAGYFTNDDVWKTYLFPGKNLWPSFEKLAEAANRSDRLQQLANAPAPKRKPALKTQAKSVAPKPTTWRFIQSDGRLMATALDLRGGTRAMLTYAGQNNWRFRVGKPKVKNPDYDIILLPNQPNLDRMATLVCGKKHNTNTGIRLCTRSEGGTHPIMHIDNLDVSALGAETHLVVKLDDGKQLVFSMKGAKEAISKLKTIHKVPAASSN